jgi:hypothetical protein
MDLFGIMLKNVLLGNVLKVYLDVIKLFDVTYEYNQLEVCASCWLNILH